MTDLNWIKIPDEESLRHKTPFQQVKAIVEAVNVYEKILYKELKKVAKAKAEIAMILVSDEYAEKVLNELKGKVEDE